jgi:hypothetical protein
MILIGNRRFLSYLNAHRVYHIPGQTNTPIWATLIRVPYKVVAHERGAIQAALALLHWGLSHCNTKFGSQVLFPGGSTHES